MDLNSSVLTVFLCLLLMLAAIFCRETETRHGGEVIAEILF